MYISGQCIPRMSSDTCFGGSSFSLNHILIITQHREIFNFFILECFKGSLSCYRFLSLSPLPFPPHHSCLVLKVSSPPCPSRMFSTQLFMWPVISLSNPIPRYIWLPPCCLYCLAALSISCSSTRLFHVIQIHLITRVTL